MTLDELHKFYGRNWSRVARELGLGKNTARAWIKKGYIPMHTQLRIEKLTEGKLLAEVTKKKDLYNVEHW